jgi:hypothetical protein
MPRARLLPLVFAGLCACDLGGDAGGMSVDASGNEPSGSGGALGSSGGVSGGAGGVASTGGRRGGRSGGSSGTDSGGTPDAAPGAAGECTRTLPGATGKEAGGLIPVCCRPSDGDKALIDEVFRLLNQHRMQNGRAPLGYDEKLEGAVQGHCRHMAEHSFFDHDAPEEAVASPWDRANLCGSSANGENIAYNQATPAEVIRTWINSSGHNQNMLDANFKRVGICHSQRRWGQLFGR